jgi:hypothetical protein
MSFGQANAGKTMLGMLQLAPSDLEARRLRGCSAQGPTE